MSFTKFVGAKKNVWFSKRYFQSLVSLIAMAIKLKLLTFWQNKLCPLLSFKSDMVSGFPLLKRCPVSQLKLEAIFFLFTASSFSLILKFLSILLTPRYGYCCWDLPGNFNNDKIWFQLPFLSVFFSFFFKWNAYFMSICRNWSVSYTHSFTRDQYENVNLCSALRRFWIITIV